MVSHGIHLGAICVENVLDIDSLVQDCSISIANAPKCIITPNNNGVCHPSTNVVVATILVPCHVSPVSASHLKIGHP